MLVKHVQQHAFAMEMNRARLCVSRLLYRLCTCITNSDDDYQLLQADNVVLHRLSESIQTHHSRYVEQLCAVVDLRPETVLLRTRSGGQ